MVQNSIYLKVLTFILVLGISLPSSNLRAQDEAASEADGMVSRSLTDLYVVGGLGLFGAVLGLSTLSFVDRPGDHLKNILVGGAIGLIVGVGVVAYTAARRGESTYKAGEDAFYHPRSKEGIEFDYQERISALEFNVEQKFQKEIPTSGPTYLTLNFSF